MRWLRETAPTKGEGFNTNNQTLDAQTWEGDLDHMISGTYTAVLSDRASNVIRVGRINEDLATGAQTYFDDDVNFIGFAGRDPLTIGQSNTHPSYVTGQGGSMVNTIIHTYVFDESFSYFVPELWGGEHTIKSGGGISWNRMDPRTTVDSGTFQFRGDAPYDPSNPATYPFQFDITIGPVGVNGFDVFSRDHRYYFFAEDKWRVANNLTLNLGLRYDNQRQTPATSNAFAPRLGFAWDVFGSGKTVVRGGVGKFYNYVPVVLDLTHQQSALVTQFPTVTVTRSAQPGAQARHDHRLGRQSRRRSVERGRPGRDQPPARHHLQPESTPRQRRPPAALPVVVERRASATSCSPTRPCQSTTWPTRPATSSGWWTSTSR